MLRRIFALTGAALFSSTLTAAAVTFDLSATSTGSSNPPLLQQSTYQNGDFSIERCCGDSIINNATEEYVLWEMDLSGQYSGQVQAVKEASLTLVFRTGGDTPRDDEMVISSAGSPGILLTPFGFTTNFTTYSRTFDLLSMVGETRLITLLNADPGVRFRTSNDTFTYRAELSMRVETLSEVPVPAGLPLMATAGFAFIALRRRKRA